MKALIGGIHRSVQTAAAHCGGQPTTLSVGPRLLENSMRKVTKEVPIALIDLDPENPRIRAAIERQGIQDPSEEQLSFHLSAAVSSVGSGGQGYRRLRESIKAAGRAYQPISLIRLSSPSLAGREYLCLDGNTRVAIYRELADQSVPGDWTTISAEIVEPNDEEDRVRSVEHIRMISHIVGAREWSPYRQAKYLYELRNKHYFSWDHIVGLCGGQVTRSALAEDITAYEMMEDYRAQVSPAAFNEHRFSAYRELVKIRGVELLENHEMTLDDFHGWVAGGVLNKDEQVRHLRSVLADDDAREILLKCLPSGLQEAIDHVQDKRRADRRRTEHAEHLRQSTLLDLARAFSDRVGHTTLTEISDLEKRPKELVEIVARLREGAEKLAAFVPD